MKHLVAAFLCLILPALAQAEPKTYRVVGVAAGDTLNVREAPAASSADIGDLPPGTGGVEIIGTDPSGKWGLIVWQESNGWVSMRFLAPDPVQRVAGTALSAGLLCGGTEPFWSLRLASGSAAYSNLDGLHFAMSLQGARVADGRDILPVQVGFAGSGASANAIISALNCGDGMSDRVYPWQIHLLLTGGGISRYQVGCCHLPLEIGFH
ncbi:MAG: hypothetical protein GY717_18660 [Rhodobacteraceae bacterium]|nr:hypothetical protein [Paracoccaceae bacterium]